MRTYLGREIGLIDHEAKFWKGVITVPTEFIIQDHHESFAASFEFEGEPAEWTEQVLPPSEECPQGTISAPRGAKVSRPICCDSYNIDITSIPLTSFSAESDDEVILGQPVYLKSNMHVALAQANSAAPSKMDGLVVVGASPTFAAKYISEGQVTRQDWTPITGTEQLTPGATYFLSAAEAGKLTTTAPTTGYIARVGKAQSSISLDIEIAQTIRL
jgi:hypothetical protein